MKVQAHSSLEPPLECNEDRTYSRHLLGAAIAPNLVPLVLKKIFLLEMVKNGICLGGVIKQNALFSEKCAHALTV